MTIKFVKFFGLHRLKSSWKSLMVMGAGLIFTLGLTYLTHRYLQNQAMEELRSISLETELKIDSRLHAHALILRAGAAFFSVSDTVTRQEWRDFVDRSRIDINLPGIEGVGYSMAILPEKLQEHIDMVRQEGFPEYKITPEGDRELYSSIVYLEPFSGRNLRAFGYDMFSEPVRRRAMELARDNDLAMLTGKVGLVQETGIDIQSGTLIYVPDYDPNMPTNTVEERRAALRGWVYSPYRMRDLMGGILGRWDEEHHDRVRLQIYDDSLSINSLLYDSQVDAGENSNFQPSRSITFPLNFNGQSWLLVFSQKSDISIFHVNVIIVFITGIIISILLYLLALSYFKIARRSRQIKKQNEELSKLNATKDKFFSIIAHDLKSPFNSIIGFSRILVEQVEKKKFDDIARFAEIIHQSSNSAMDLLMNLMEWSQSQTGRIVFNPREFDLSELIWEVKLLFAEVARLKAIDIKTVVPEKLIVFADHDMMGTILRNLISNALKFTHSGGQITIKVRENSNAIMVSVSDTGVGIPGDMISKLFRIDDSYTTKGTQNEKGTGLGLILCREFVDKHGGKIWVESTPKDMAGDKASGSTFYFTIPLVENR